MIERNLQVQLDYVGQKFKNLTVLSFNGYRYTDRKPLFGVRCDCGEIDERTASSLRREYNEKFFCRGCNPKRPFTMLGMLSLAHWNRLKSVASIRGIEFDVSPEYLTDLFSKQGGRCALTGWPIKITPRVGDSKNMTASLDRIDSDGDYVEGNVQWVDKDVNRMKWAYGQDDFIAVCRAVVDNFWEPNDCDSDWGDEG